MQRQCWYDGIRYKIRNNLGLPDRLVRVLSSFLTDRTLQVTEMGLFSTIINLKAGTPQGNCLSPLIYLISVNDLPTGDQRGTSQFQFADDKAVNGSLTKMRFWQFGKCRELWITSKAGVGNGG